MSDDLRMVSRRVSGLLIELRELLQAGPQIRIVHRFHRAGTECQAGEEIWKISLVIRGREILLPLSLSLLMLVDYLARTRHVPQSSTQIAAGMRKTDFYRRHGANSGLQSVRKISRSAIKEYVKRIRSALQIAFEETSLGLDPNQVLGSKETVSNQVNYQLHATVEWVHLEISDSD